jgi:hypothetical protein
LAQYFLVPGKVGGMYCPNLLCTFSPLPKSDKTSGFYLEIFVWGGRGRGIFTHSPPSHKSLIHFVVFRCNVVYYSNII